MDSYDLGYLSVSLYDKSWLFPVIPKENEKDDFEQRQDTNDGLDDGTVIEIKDPPPPKCCVNTLTTPQGNVKTYTANDKNNVGLPIIHIFPKTFLIEFKFNENPDPCKCSCCQYKQRVKGTARLIAPGGKKIDLWPVFDYKAVPGGGAPKPVKKSNKDGVIPNFVEDTKGKPKSPGKPAAFGHKPSRNPGHDGYDDNGCGGWASDFPSYTSLISPPGARKITVDIDVTFQGCIIDTCKNTVAQSKEWKWKHNKQY